MTPQRPIWTPLGTVAVRDFWENGCRGGQSVGWAKSINWASVTTDDRFQIDFFTCRQRGLHAAENRLMEVTLQALVFGCCSCSYRRYAQSFTHSCLSSNTLALVPVVLFCGSPAPCLALLSHPRSPPCSWAPPPLPALLFGASPTPRHAFRRMPRSRPCLSAPPPLPALPLGASPAPPRRFSAPPSDVHHWSSTALGPRAGSSI